MPHCDPDSLALVALGEREPDASERAHLGSCATCRADLAGLTATVEVAREAEWAVGRQGGVALQAPPERVWSVVRERISTDSSDQPASLRPAMAPAAGAASPRGRGWLVGVAAAACVVALAGSFLLGRSATQQTPGTAVASAPLAALPGEPATGSGTAVLVQRDGSYALEVSTQGLPATEGFYEVWLINPADSGLVSLGSIPTSQGRATLPVPEGLPLSSFSVVDVSDEPLDGDPAHSKVSVLRGQFSV